MKIIPPHKISAEIVDLVYEAQEYLVLVSPYVNLSKWEDLKRAIEHANKRGVRIQFFTRNEADNQNSWEEIQELGIKPKMVSNLHAKLYFSEQRGIVTSMNLLSSSSKSAIEFGTYYDQPKEIEELQSYIKKYLNPQVSEEPLNEDELYFTRENFSLALKNAIQHNFNRRIKCFFQDGKFKISAGGNTYGFWLETLERTLNGYGLVSGAEFEGYQMFQKEYEKSFPYMEVPTPVDPGEKFICSISASSKIQFSKSNFNYLKVKEKMQVIDAIVGFIVIMHDFKDESYRRRKENPNTH